MLNITTIKLLFSRGGPTYIAGLVMAVIVFTVETVQRGWLAAQLRKKIRERGESKFDAPTAVVGIPFLFGVGATLLRRAKAIVFGRRATVDDFTVNGAGLSDSFGHKATAGGSMAGKQVVGGRGAKVTALTPAEPQHFFALSGIDAEHGQLAEGLTHKVPEVVSGRTKRVKRFARKQHGLLYHGGLLCAAFFVFTITCNAQTQCPPNMVCISPEAAKRSLQLSDELEAEKKQTAALTQAVDDLKKEIDRLQVEIAKQTGEKTGAQEMVVRLTAIIDFMLKNGRVKKYGVINF